MKYSYDKEVAAKWGNSDQYIEYTNKTKNYSQDEFLVIIDGLNTIFKKFSVNLNLKLEPNSLSTLELVEELKDYITKYFYNCSNKILLNLGLMYVSDERFENNIDKNGKGTANYIKEAIVYYCEENNE